MKTLVYHPDPTQPAAEMLQEAAAVIRNGGLVAFPTETVYGLGADALNPTAAKKIYEAKGRPSDNPLIVHIAEMDSLTEIAKTVPEAARKLAAVYWPGPLTMIFEKKEIVPTETTGGLATVAVRMPDHPVALGLIRESGGFIAAPSANRSGRPSPTSAEHVRTDLDGRVDIILDGGPAVIGLESTIVDFTADVPTLLRPGYVNLEMLREVLGEVALDPSLLSGKESSARPKAPGMRYRHYAPAASLSILRGKRDVVIEEIQRRIAADQAAGRKVGVLASKESAPRYAAELVVALGAIDNEREIASHLFDALRQMDDAGVDSIYSESFDTKELGMAIMNRLVKAAGYTVIDVKEEQ